MAVWSRAVTIPDYFASVSRNLQNDSERVRSSFKAHRPTAGTNREAIISSFMGRHLPKVFGVGTGLVMSKDGVFSNQADIVVYDQLMNAPLNADLPATLFTVESVYALIEAKTVITPSELKDAIGKCRRFKCLNRTFLDRPLEPRLTESLFVIFAFEAAKPETVKENWGQAIAHVPVHERPDMLVVPGSLVLICGQYFDLVRLGQPGSSWRMGVEGKGAAHVASLIGDGYEVSEMGDHSLMAFFIWFTSWLQHAGSRGVALQSYLPPDKVWGRRV